MFFAAGTGMGRAVVVRFSVDVPGLVLCSVTDVVVKLQAAWVGTPEPHDNEIFVPYTGFGVRVTPNTAVSPAACKVTFFGLMSRLKSDIFAGTVV